MTAQLQNLKNLLALGERLLRERKNDLGFGLWDCGTYACLAGHYGREYRIDKEVYADMHWARAHFGLSDPLETLDIDPANDEWDRLFGTGFLSGAGLSDIRTPGNVPGEAAYVELERRMEYLRKLIAERSPKRDAIPASVRAIFAVKEVA